MTIRKAGSSTAKRPDRLTVLHLRHLGEHGQNQNGRFTPDRECPPPPLLPSSTSSLLPGHVGLRQHPSTVGALPPLCSVHSWCNGVGALNCVLSYCFPSLLTSPCNALAGFARSSMPRYIVFGDIFATCSAPSSTGIFRSLPHSPLSMVLPATLQGKSGVAPAACKYLSLLFMHSHLVDSESALRFAHFPTVGISAYEVLHLLSFCLLSVSSCFLTPFYSHLVGSPGVMVTLFFCTFPCVPLVSSLLPSMHSCLGPFYLLLSNRCSSP